MQHLQQAFSPAKGSLLPQGRGLPPGQEPGTPQEAQVPYGRGPGHPAGTETRLFIIVCLHVRLQVPESCACACPACVVQVTTLDTSKQLLSNTKTLEATSLSQDLVVSHGSTPSSPLLVLLRLLG